MGDGRLEEISEERRGEERRWRGVVVSNARVEYGRMKSVSDESIL